METRNKTLQEEKMKDNTKAKHLGLDENSKTNLETTARKIAEAGESSQQALGLIPSNLVFGDVESNLALEGIGGNILAGLKALGLELKRDTGISIATNIETAGEDNKKGLDG